MSPSDFVAAWSGPLRVPSLALVAVLACACLVAPTSARAACDASCTRLIDPSESTVDLSALSPGDHVCVPAGTRTSILRLQGMAGTSQAPIVVRNCGGVAELAPPDNWAFVVEDSTHVRITGTGEGGVDMGMVLRAPFAATFQATALGVLGSSSHVEIDHVEVAEAAFNGIRIVSPVSCARPELQRPGFVAQGFHVHDNHVHDTGGEGIKVGSSSFYDGLAPDGGICGTLLPPEVHDLVIEDNLVEDTDWDGIEVGAAIGPCEIVRNDIRRAGATDTAFQNRGLHLMGGSGCLVEANVIEGVPPSLVDVGAQTTQLVNNVVLGGISVSQAGAPPASDKLIAHNTIVGGFDSFGLVNGIRVVNTSLTADSVVNNLVVDVPATAPWEVFSSPAAPLVAGNLHVELAADAGFVDAPGLDLHLVSDSPARDAGVDSASLGVVTDADGSPRDAAPDPGAFELLAAAVPGPAAVASGLVALSVGLGGFAALRRRASRRP